MNLAANSANCKFIAVLLPIYDAERGFSKPGNWHHTKLSQIRMLPITGSSVQNSLLIYAYLVSGTTNTIVF